MKDQALIIRAFIIIAVIFALIAVNSSLNLIRFPEKIYYHYFLWAILVQGLYWLVSSICWQRTLSASSGADISLQQSFTHVLLVLVGKYIPGKVWGILERNRQLTRSGVSYIHSTSATFLEQILIFHTGALLSLFGWVLIFAHALHWLVIGVACGSLIVVPVFHRRFLTWGAIIYKLLKHQEINLSHNRISGAEYLQLFMIYLLDWLALGGVQLCLYLALFNKALTLEFVLLLLGANAFGIIAGFVAFFMPGGIGVREGVTASILASVIPLADAALLVVVFRLWLICAEFVGGGVCLLAGRSRSV